MTSTRAFSIFFILVSVLLVQKNEGFSPSAIGSNNFQKSAVATSARTHPTTVAFLRKERSFGMDGGNSVRHSNGQQHQQLQWQGHRDSSAHGDPSKAGNNDASESNANHKNEKEQPKKGYQRAEDWDAEQKAGGSLDWEQKVQFDGLRMGNGIRQNDILMRQLSKF